MAIMLGIIAGLIFITYFYYFFQIMRGRPASFEIGIIKTLAAWMIERGALVKRQLWMMLFIALCLEIIYLVLTFIVFNNLAIISYTIFLAGFECVHYIILMVTFTKFFQGEIVIKYLFNWRVERNSAILLFTHAILIMLAMVMQQY